jgi:AmmeMemoRadiSam system protein A
VNHLFDHQQRKAILALARRAIDEYLESGTEIHPPGEDYFLQPLAAFVTLTMDGELRGCIGTTEANTPLGETIVHCAISAATRDPRFPPVQNNELQQIQLEVSVLSPFRVVRRLEEIEIGVHGVLVKMGPYRALFLPQVAVENNWDRETFLSYACRKAGLNPNAWKMPAMTVEVFSAEVFGEED